MDADAQVRDYLGRLEVAASELPAERRAELVGDVREHIGLALAEAGQYDEDAVGRVLARIGAPETIVAAELTPVTSMPSAPRAPDSPGAAPSRALSVEARALLLLTVGALVLPFIGPVIGLWFVSASTRWTLKQKRTAALIVVVLLAMPAVLLLPAIVAGEWTWVVTSGGFSLPFVPAAGLTAAIYLVATSSFVVTVSRRPQAELS